jgi:hypothetical protein
MMQHGETNDRIKTRVRDGHCRRISRNHPDSALPYSPRQRGRTSGIDLDAGQITREFPETGGSDTRARSELKNIRSKLNAFESPGNDMRLHNALPHARVAQPSMSEVQIAPFSTG